MVAVQTRKCKRVKTAEKRDTESKQDSVATPKPAPAANQPVQYDEAVESAKAERLAAVWRAFDKLRRKANKGDRQARVLLVRFCNSNPHLWTMLGDTAKLVETSLIDMIVQGEWLSGRAITREADQLRKQLSRPSQSPLEELAVRRLVACKMQADFVDSQCSRVDGTVEQAKFWLQRQAQAHRLYAAAEKSLRLIRGSIPAAVQSGNDAPGNVKPEQADKIQGDATKSLLLIRSQLPVAPASPPAIADARPQPAHPEVGDTTEPPYVPVEILTANGHGANRITDIISRRSASRCFVAGDQACEPPKLNGHRYHRLEELLVNGTNGHTKNGGST